PRYFTSPVCPAPPTLSLHDALPIYRSAAGSDSITRAPTVSPPRNSTVISSIECATWAAVITLPSAEIRTPEPVSLNVEMPRAAVTSRPFARTTTTEGLMVRNSSPTAWACAASAPTATRIPTSPAPTLRRGATRTQPEEIEQDGGERVRDDDE